MKLKAAEIATRQLDTAIDLYFRNDDPVSTHSLAMNAYEIAGKLCRARGLETLHSRLEGLLTKDRQKIAHDVLHASRNMFKHARPDGEIEFNDEDNLFFLAMASLLLNKAEIRTDASTAFMLWIAAIAPNLREANDALTPYIVDISGLDRQAQKVIGLDYLTSSRDKKLASMLFWVASRGQAAPRRPATHHQPLRQPQPLPACGRCARAY